MRMCGARRLVASGWVVGAVVLAGARGGQVPAQDARSKPAAQQPADNPRADGAATEMVRMLRGGGMQLEKIVNEKRQAYRSLLSSELSFCRVACDLTKEQSQRIARCSAAMIEEAAQTAARLDLKPAQRGGIRYAGEPALLNAVKLVRRSLEQLVKEHGSPEQQNRYRLELARRAARQRQTAIWGLVARLDRILIFSSVFSASGWCRCWIPNWDEEWECVTAGVAAADWEPLPAIPDRLVIPLLSASQQVRWNRMEKQGIDATSAYLQYVDDIVTDLPSELPGVLETASPAAADTPEGLSRFVEGKSGSK